MANKFITSVDATDTTKEEDLFFVNVDKKIKQIQKDNLRFDYEKHIENKPSIDGVEMVGDKSLDDFRIPNKKELDNIKTDIEELQHRMSPAIVNTANGETIVVRDSSDNFFEDFRVLGKSEQGGNPSVDNHQEIKSVGENGTIKIKLQGKNLITFPYLENNKTENGITWIVHDNGAITVKGTATEEVYFNLCNVDFGPEDFFTYDHVEYREYTVSISKTPKNVHISYSGTTKLCYLTVPSGKTVDATLYPQIEYGRKEVATTYEQWKGEQTLTIQLEQPLTKWDRIEKRDGVLRIVRKGRKITLRGNEEWSMYEDKAHTFSCPNNFIIDDGLCTHYKKINSGDLDAKTGIYLTYTSLVIVTDLSVNNVEEFKALLSEKEQAGTPLEIICSAQTETLEPLTQETQQALNALHTYYPNTTVTNSEDAHMEVSYVADTKLYIDSKLQEIVKEQLRTNELILERTM